jgi:hypothetical protein
MFYYDFFLSYSSINLSKIEGYLYISPSGYYSSDIKFLFRAVESKGKSA